VTVLIVFQLNVCIHLNFDRFNLMSQRNFNFKTVFISHVIEFFLISNLTSEIIFKVKTALF